jgi:hypothetical protein
MRAPSLDPSNSLQELNSSSIHSDLVYKGALLGPVAVGSVRHLARLVTSLLVTSLLVTSLLVTSLLVVFRLVQARKAQAAEETGGLGDLGEGGGGGGP